MNTQRMMALINGSLLIMLAVPIGLQSDESNTTAAITNVAGRKTAEDKMEIMKGVWEIQTQGTQGNWGQDVKALTQNFALIFSDDKKDKNPITGIPFGFKIIKSSVQSAKRNDSVRFKVTYRLDKDYDIDFHGKLNEDGTEISDGKFSFILGKGTFTGKKSNP